MLNKVLRFVRERQMLTSGDRLICAVSGGADSVALLFAMYLLRDKLGILLEAAHFNHHLRGEESDRDEAFVRQLCDRYDIPLHVGDAHVRAGEKGLEAAAREARYGYLRSLGGKIATAHTADDNAETVLMHLIRGTGLKGLGGITPINGSIIRPMLGVTRQEVEAFNREWCLSAIEDSSNASDAFLRNRLRRHVMPLLKQENPRLAENLSAMALRLREDEAYLSLQAQRETLLGVEEMKAMHPAIRSRVLERFLKDSGVREPEQSHIAMAEGLLHSEKPSAKARLPGGVTIARRYDRLEAVPRTAPPEAVNLPVNGSAEWNGLRITCTQTEIPINTPDAFTVAPRGAIQIRPRQSGDSMRLPGGTKSLKKLFIDRKIPADARPFVPVIADEQGVLGVYTIGPNLDRTAATQSAVTIRFIKTEKKGD